jgi:hypothetical protein
LVVSRSRLMVSVDVKVGMGLATLSRHVHEL